MWTEEKNALRATVKFKNFTRAFAFMAEVAFCAERQGHHPDWQNVYNTVHFVLNTHDAGGTVTDKDRKLAAAIEEIYERHKD